MSITRKYSFKFQQKSKSQISRLVFLFMTFNMAGTEVFTGKNENEDKDKNKNKIAARELFLCAIKI